MESLFLQTHNPMWLDILSQIRHDVYHLPVYLELEAKRTKTVAEAFVALDGENIFFVPFLVRSCEDIFGSSESIYDIISPYGYPGIILSKTAEKSSSFVEAAIGSFIDRLKQKDICSIFLRLHPILSHSLISILSEKTLTENGVTVSVDLTLSESEIWAHTRKGHQSSINKTKRLGFVARMVPVENYYEQFIEIYEETMSRVSAKDDYFFDREYYKNLLALGEKLHLCIVEKDDELAAASLFFECCGVVQAHLAGTKNEFLKQSPFMEVLNYTRYWAKERGNEFLHLGGGIGGSGEDRLYIFKSGFSRQRHAFHTLRLVTDPDRYEKLIQTRAQALNLSSDVLRASTFFPAYRANPS
ncbi:MAG: GNAT family N-acetyltransferase [Thermosynechococcaceae cyanobacterium]